MALKQTQINKILNKYGDVFEALENYDKTRELPSQRKRIDIDLVKQFKEGLEDLKSGKIVFKK